MAKKKRKDYIIKPWHTRQFLRPKGDACGPGSVLQAKFSARRAEETKYNRETEKREPTGRKYISISGSFSLRDCANEVSLSFYAGCEGRKRAVAHAKALDKLADAINVLRDDYWIAIETADIEGLWLEDKDNGLDDDY